MRFVLLVFVLLSVLFIFGCFSYNEPPEINAEEFKNPTQAKQKNIHNEVEQMKNLQILDIHPASIPDGKYTGEIPFMKYMYRVQVTIESGKIKNIEVLDNGTGNKYAEKGLQVIPRMLKKQSPKVDAVTGATVTSKALMKCVEKALDQNKQQE